MLLHPGKAVENGAFPGIGVAGQDNDNSFFRGFLPPGIIPGEL
jgi:hypothetical protein